MLSLVYDKRNKSDLLWIMSSKFQYLVGHLLALAFKVKNALFRSFCTPMYASQLWCNFRKSCVQRLRVAHNFEFRALYKLPWRASISTHQVQCNIPTFEALLRKYTYLFLERCRKSNNVWLHALMQSDYLHSSLFFEQYNRILLCEWVIELCSIRLIDGVWCHIPQCFRILPRLDQFRNWRPTAQ